MRKVLTLFLACASLWIFACVGYPQSTSDRTYRQTQGSSPPQASASRESGVIRLRPYVVMDSVLGIEAFRFLVPVDWKVEGGVVWRQVPTRPAAVAMRVLNPQGVEETGTFPDIPCVWSQRPLFGFPEGSVYLGNEVRRPIADALQAIQMMVVPRYRPHLRGATTVKQEALPELAQAWAAVYYPDVQQARFNGGKIRFQYQQSGKTVEEDVYTVVGMFTVPILGVPTTFWGLDAIYYSKAEKGKLDQQYKLFQTMYYSNKLSLRWFSRYAQVRELMIQNEMEASNRAVQLSRYISRTNEQISDVIRQSYERRQAAMDRVNANWDRHIRGVEDYRDPWGGSSSIQLPSGYNHAWANSRGEYILSDSGNFNPNIGTNQEWRPMAKQR